MFRIPQSRRKNLLNPQESPFGRNNMPFAEINDISMHYHDEGEGTPVILVTGFSGDTTFFRALIPDLVDEGYRVITFDHRGAGLTSYPMEKGIHAQTMVDDLKALIDYLGIDKAHYLGWSLGAHVMQEYAVQFPERLLSLTLISAYPYHPARSSYFMNGICDCALAGGPPEYISMMTNAFCFTEDFFMSLEEKGKKLRSLEGLNPRGLKMQMNALDEFDTREKVKDIKAPTLSIHGLSDIMVEPKLGDFISDRIPNCKVLRIPDVGHVIKPSLYSEEFIKFIRSHDEA